MQELNIPYCGLPPVPADIWLQWNLDPVLIAILAFAAALHVNYLRRTRSSRASQISAGSGWLVLAAALISPLCSLGVALFSARVTQHMVIVLIAAPLLAHSLPIRPRWFTRAAPAVALFAVLLWFWHVPAAYDATFTSDIAYWLMHVSLLVSAIIVWRTLLPSRGAEPVHICLLAQFATLLQMGLLGAILTLAPRLLYSAHTFSTLPWHLTPLEDQQLGGLVMWIPGCAVLAFVMLWSLGRMLRRNARSASNPVLR